MPEVMANSAKSTHNEKEGEEASGSTTPERASGSNTPEAASLSLPGDTKLVPRSSRAKEKKANSQFTKYSRLSPKGFLNIFWNVLVTQKFLDAAQELSGRFSKTNLVDENINMA